MWCTVVYTGGTGPGVVPGVPGWYRAQTTLLYYPAWVHQLGYPGPVLPWCTPAGLPGPGTTLYSLGYPGLDYPACGLSCLTPEPGLRNPAQRVVQ